MQLTKTEQKFILHWGEMGSKWGINRTVAQIHALLIISSKPLNAEEIASHLSVARSNVSSSLKELQGWEIVKVVHVLGDRREHFESLKDVWEMFRIILEKRKKRELDPTITILRECLDDFQKSKEKDPFLKERLSSLLELFESTNDVYEKSFQLPISVVKQLVKSSKSFDSFFSQSQKKKSEGKHE